MLHELLSTYFSSSIIGSYYCTWTLGNEMEGPLLSRDNPSKLLTLLALGLLRLTEDDGPSALIDPNPSCLD